MARSVAEHQHVAVDVARHALATFGAELAAEALLLESDADADVAATIELPPETAGQVWEVPKFEKFTDMQDLLLFDPIHEVQPSGWPAVTRDET